jgi:Tfp pilus assembly PilM family ATPase
MGISSLSAWAGRAQRLLKATELPMAVDFGVGSLKVLQVAAMEESSPMLSLVSAGMIETPAELLGEPAKRLAYQAQALPRLMKSCGFKGKRMVCAIPASHSSCRHMQLPAGHAASVASSARALLPLQMGVDVSQVLVKHVEVGAVGRAKPGSGKTEVICMGVAREVVDGLMSAILACKGEPVGMHAEYEAIVTAFWHITRRTSDAKMTTLFVDLGAGTTKVMLAHGRSLVFARSIDFGGRHMDQAVAKAMKLELQQARQQRLALIPPEPELPVLGEAPSARDGEEERRGAGRPSGLSGDVRDQPQAQALPTQLAEPLEIMTDEIATCLRYYESMFPEQRIGRVIFVGGEARHTGLCQHIARVLRVPAQVADPMACVSRTGREPMYGVDFKSPQPGWAVALGLCLAPTDL